MRTLTHNQQNRAQSSFGREIAKFACATTSLQRKHIVLIKADQIQIYLQVTSLQNSF